jgi:protein ImuB
MIACLLAPHLPLQVEVARDPALATLPLIIYGRAWDAAAVLDCCPAAEAAGVRAGMRLSRAESLCTQARFLPADEAAYTAAHQALQDALGHFTEQVETVGMGSFLAEVRSPQCFPTSGAALARRMVAEARAACGLDVRLGLAGSCFAAAQAAHAARPNDWCLVHPQQEPAFLSPLPLATLPADAESLRRLRMLGVHTLGELAALPRLALISQFGAPAGLWHDLASGRDPRTVQANAPPLLLEASHTFEPAVATLAPLTAHLTRLVAAQAADLARRGYHAGGVKVELEDESGARHTATAAVEPPTADAALLSRRAVAVLERLHFSCPMTVLRLTLYPLRPAYLGATQLALFTGPLDERRRRLQEVLRRLRERFGEMIVVVAALLRPPPPCPIQVTISPSGEPCALVWPDRILPVARVYEHWRERRRWWARPLRRDYYRVELADAQVRVVFRDLGEERWWLERRSV